MTQWLCSNLFSKAPLSGTWGLEGASGSSSAGAESLSKDRMKEGQLELLQ